MDLDIYSVRKKACPIGGKVTPKSRWSTGWESEAYGFKLSFYFNTSDLCFSLLKD